MQMQKLENKNDLTQAELNKILSYDPVTGIFRWKKALAKRIRVGDIAGNLRSSDGYIIITIRGIGFYAHRLAWRMITGEWPEVIDHINRSRADNRWSNLRAVTHLENNRNRSLPKSNRSGYMGVYPLDCGRFRAQIRALGTYYHLGLFDDAADAHKAYLAAAAKLHGGYNSGATAL